MGPFVNVNCKTEMQKHGTMEMCRFFALNLFERPPSPQVEELFGWMILQTVYCCCMLIPIVNWAQSVFILGCFQGSCCLRRRARIENPLLVKGDGPNEMGEVRLGVASRKLLAN